MTDGYGPARFNFNLPIALSRPQDPARQGRDRPTLATLGEGSTDYYALGRQLMALGDMHGLGPMQLGRMRAEAQQFSANGSRTEECFNTCRYLLDVGHGNEYRGCFRRCMGQPLGALD